jgi:hypothetical protein
MTADEEVKRLTDELIALGKHPVTDLSQRAVRIGRMIDRLGAGEFSIKIAKPEGESGTWKVEVEQNKRVRTMEL